MSFLVEDEPQTTLAVALADACDSDGSTTSSAGFRGDSPASLRVVLRKPPASTQSQTSQQPSSRAKSTKKHREGKKVELLSLREQLAYLESCLSSLQLARASGKRNSLQILLRKRIGDSACDENQRLKTLLLFTHSVDVNASTTWFDVALRQAKERAKSEALNDDDLMSPIESKLLEELHEQLQEMYLIAGFMVDHQNQNQSQPDDSQQSSTASSSTTTDSGGMSVEFRTETSLKCSFQEPGRAMWQRIYRQETIAHAGKYVLESRDLTSVSFQKHYTLFLETPDHQPVEFRGTSYIHKFDEANRFLQLWTSAVFMPSHGLRFAEKGWIVATQCPVTKSPLVPAGSAEPLASVVKTCYQVSCISAAEYTQSSGRRGLVELVLQTLSRRTREYQQRMQGQLLDDFSSLKDHLRSSAPMA